MSTELVKISPENLEVANAYLQYGNILDTASMLGISPDRVTEVLDLKEVKRYIDNIYLDQGYRNREKLGKLLDQVIESKLEEALESGVYSNKDLADLIALAHKMRNEELKLQESREKRDVGILIPTEGSNYGKLMEKLLGDDIPGTPI